MRGVAADLNFADRLRVAGLQAGIATNATAGTAVVRPALVRSAIRARSSWATAPSTCRKNIPLRGGGIDRITQTAESAPLASVAR